MPPESHAEPSATEIGAGTAADKEAPYYVKASALGILAILLGFQISGWVFAIRAVQDGRVDFRSFYTAGHIIRSGRSRLLYDYAFQVSLQNQVVSARTMALPFIHPPYEAILFVPFSYLKFRGAYVAYLLFNVGMLAIAARLTRSWTPNLNQIYPWLSSAMMFLFLPTVVAFMQGQDSIILLLCLIASFAALERNRQGLAGVLLSLGLFKFQIVLPIALLFLGWRRWRFALGFALSGLALGVGSLAMVGIEGAKSYVQLLLSISARLSSQSEQASFGIPPLMMPNLRGLMFGLFGWAMSPAGIQTAVLALSAVCLLVTLVGSPKSSRRENGFLIAIIASAIVSYHSLIHDMSILLLPILLLLNQCIPGVGAKGSLERRVAEITSLAFISPMLLPFAPGRFYMVALVLGVFLYAALRWTSGAPVSSSAAPAE